MDKNLIKDRDNINKVLRKVLDESVNFLEKVDERPVTVPSFMQDFLNLPSEGTGAEEAIDKFIERYANGLSSSVGPRYFGFVTGGATPASIAGDWMVSVFDQNVTSLEDSTAGYVELETINFFRQLFGLKEVHSGTFVTGATMANFVGLALARQYVAKQIGIDVAKQGLHLLPKIKVFSGSPHSSVYKALAMLGMGRDSLEIVSTLPDREAVDVSKLKDHLEKSKERSCIVIANAGTVNTVDFDDLKEIANLKKKYNFWLHIDAAFGGYAACSPRYKQLVEGINEADSITIDAHKWLNVPYDSAMQFTRHKDLQVELFQNNAVYLGNSIENPEFVHLTPENSRRFRALPAWLSLMAYGKNGYQEIIERNCQLAQDLSNRIEASSYFRLLAPTRLNVVCFTIKTDEILLNDVKGFLSKVNSNGKVFLTPTMYKGIPAIRAAISNWRTTTSDIDIVWDSILSIISSFFESKN